MSANVNNGTMVVKRVGSTERPDRPAQIGDKAVVKANNQISKNWFLLSKIIGALVIAFGVGLGCMGLLQSYDLISLPESLSAIGTIGNAYLWAMTAGSLIGGGMLILRGLSNVGNQRSSFPKADELPEEDDEDPLEFDIFPNLESAREDEPVIEFPHTEEFANLFKKPSLNYAFKPDPLNEGYQFLCIKNENKEGYIGCRIRESSRSLRQFRIITKDTRQKFQESGLLFTAPQIASILRYTSNPNYDFGQSSLTQISNLTGFIIFTKKDSPTKEHYVVNVQGVLQKVDMRPTLSRVDAKDKKALVHLIFQLKKEGVLL